MGGRDWRPVRGGEEPPCGFFHACARPLWVDRAGSRKARRCLAGTPTRSAPPTPIGVWVCGSSSERIEATMTTIVSSCVEIDVSTPSHQNVFALVDSCDYQRVTQGAKWFAKLEKGKRFYVIRNNREIGLVERLHRVILDAQPGDVIDHINGSGLDNRRINLRFVSASENLRNSSISRRNVTGFKGVHVGGSKSWYAAIYLDSRLVRLGTYPTPQIAAEAYDEAAIQHFGQFARTNRAMGLLGGAS
jgi:hypothetical protein